MDATPNPLWVDQLLSEHWEALEGLVGKRLMPKCEGLERRPMLPRCQELGCGEYGCVMPTETPGVVFKITSDSSEAAFVSAAFKIGKLHPGIVRYDLIVELPAKYERRRTFAVWREEADNVGAAGDYVGTRGEEEAEHFDLRYGRGSFIDYVGEMMSFMKLSAKVRAIVRRSKTPAALLDEANSRRGRIAKKAARDGKHFRWWNLEGADRLAWDTLQLGEIALKMANTGAAPLVGQALAFYLKHGILLADVHFGNIGEVMPEGSKQWELVITDPGHMVPLSKKWLRVPVQQLYERKRG